MRLTRRLILAAGLFAAGLAPVEAVELFDGRCEFAGQCANPVPRGGRVFRPLERQNPPAGIEVPQPGPVQIMPRLQLQPALREHIGWCSSRYRSYRSGDDTYSPKAGVRRPCISPYN